MKSTNRMSNLYGALTNKERAILTFQHLVRGDKGVIGQITASVPLKKYICADVEYDRWYDAVWDFSSTYATEYWRLATWASRKFQAISYFFNHNDLDASEEAGDMFMEASEKAIALTRAMESLCEEHGIDPNIVREFSGTDQEFTYSHPNPDRDKVEMYKQRLSRLLPRQ